MANAGKHSMYDLSNSGEFKMCGLRLLKCVVVFGILETLIRIVNGHNNAFINTENELRFLMDGVTVAMSEEEFGEENIKEGLNNHYGLHTFRSVIKLDPASLDFRENPVGMPSVQRVTLYNINLQKNLDMYSISGSTVHFHCSFFREKILPPLMNTTFDVVFLAREEGRIESSLYFHTSFGTFKYEVKGVGVANPYRLRPLIGAKVPVNSSFTPIINMHNPHSSTLLVTEMYSSGGHLHLELPSGQMDAPKDIWEIPPYQTRPVIKANFIARVESNHTGYIRIKTNSSISDYLVLPVEVEVSSQPGLYYTQEILDFGIIASMDRSKTLQLLLLNSGSKSILVQTIVVVPANDAVQVNFNPVKVPPDTSMPTVVGTVTFDPSKVVSVKQWCGRIVIKSKNNQFKVAIPYKSQVLKGELVYNSSYTKFYVGEKQLVEDDFRLFNMTNTFNVSVVIHNVSLPTDVQKYFKVMLYTPVVLKPQETRPLFKISLNMRYISSDFHLSTRLAVFTNITHIEIPVICYNGKLTKFLPNVGSAEVIEFGTLGMGTKRDMYFTVINENPIELRLRGWGSNLSRSIVELIGVEKGNASVIIRRHSFLDMTKSLFLKAYHYAVFRLAVTAPDAEGFLEGEAFVQTQYEQLKVPFWLRTAEGSLITVPEVITFENTFPGKLSVHKLHIFSSFSHAMIITNISSVAPDRRFYFRPEKEETRVESKVKTYVGRLYFDPGRDCEDDCYAGFSKDNTKFYKPFLQGFSLPSTVRETDFATATELFSRFTDMTLSKSSFNLTLQADTSEVKGFLFQGQVSLRWPSLLQCKIINFPITQIQNTSYREFMLYNTASRPVAVHIVPVSLYPGVSQLPEHLHSDIFPISGAEYFTIPGLRNSSDNLISQTKHLEEILGSRSHQDTGAILLQPGGKYKIQIAFSPIDELPRSSMILLRNNLTGLEVVNIRGQGAYGQFKFGHSNPNFSSPLLFKITEKHLKDCEKSTSSHYTPPNLTVRISFTARNMGELPIQIFGFFVNDQPCEGNGFRVLNCESFQLRANGSRKIDIAFTPDFTLTRVERTLQILTSLTPSPLLNYSLVATIPVFMLTACAKALPRPSWELLMYYSLTSCMILMLFAVLAFAVYDSECLARAMYLQASNISIPPVYKCDKDKILDLKLIKQNVDSDVARHNGSLISSSKISTNKSVSDNKEIKNNHTKEWESESETNNNKISKSKSKTITNGNLDKEPNKKSTWSTLFGSNSEKNKEAKSKNKFKLEDLYATNEEKKNRRRKEKEKKNKGSTEEETCSTTTESSNPDDETEKSLKSAEKLIKEKSKKIPDKKSNIRDRSNETNDTEYSEAIVKSKKKSSKLAITSLELPYKLSATKDTILEKVKVKSKKSTRTKGQPTPSPEEYASPITWENGRKFSVEESVSDATAQVEAYANRSSPNSSYSSVVSNGSGDPVAAKRKTKTTVVTKVPPEHVIKKEVTKQRSLDSIGQRPPRANVWSNEVSAPYPLWSSGYNDNGQAGFLRNDDYGFIGTSPSPYLMDNQMTNGEGPYPLGWLGEKGNNLTQRRHVLRDDWPGLNMDKTWDDEPHQERSFSPAITPPSASQDKANQSTFWTSISSVWNSSYNKMGTRESDDPTVHIPPIGTPSYGGLLDNNGVMPDPGSDDPFVNSVDMETNGEKCYDPFHSLNTIWSPRAPASTDSWNHFFSNKEN